ncbi:terpenoid synthase [Thozetella sp. PMI_491]|nr:terpenoid synthase [Thozetella sp. PMI_491]
MEYKNSTLVDPSAYETEGICEGIPLRVFRDQALEDIGVIRAQQDWRKYVGPVDFKRGSLGPEWNFLSVAFPETHPARMEILAYFDEFIFLHDDVVEAVDKVKGDSQNDEALAACHEATAERATSMEARKATGRRLMISKVSSKMLATDPGPAKAALRLWGEWFAKGAGRENHTQFDSLAEYMEYRILDVGKMYLTGVAIFALSLSIPEAEVELRSQLCRPAWIALGLTNDLYSLWKERDAAEEMGEASVCNALWVMMREHSISEKEAERLCRQKIAQHVAEYAQVVQDTSKRQDISRDLRVFVEAIQYVLSGNLQWTRGAPRYHPELTYNARQLDWMANGVPEA